MYRNQIFQTSNSEIVKTQSQAQALDTSIQTSTTEISDSAIRPDTPGNQDNARVRYPSMMIHVDRIRDAVSFAELKNFYNV